MWINPTGNAPPIKFEKSGRTPSQSSAPCSASLIAKGGIVGIFNCFWRGVLRRAFSRLSLPSSLLLLSPSLFSGVYSSPDGFLLARFGVSRFPAAASPLSDSLHQTLVPRLARCSGLVNEMEVSGKPRRGC